MSESAPEAVDRIAAVCERASTALAVLAGVAFLASFPLAGSQGHTTVVSIAVALGGGSLLCGGVSGLRNPAEMVGEGVPSPEVPTDETIRSRHEASGYATLYVAVGLLLFVVGVLAALSTL